VFKRTPLKGFVPCSSRGVLLHTVLDEGTLYIGKPPGGGRGFSIKVPAKRRPRLRIADVLREKEERKDIDADTGTDTDTATVKATATDTDTDTEIETEKERKKEREGQR